VTASAAFPPQPLPIHLAAPYVHLQIEVLRRPVESALDLDVVNVAGQEYVGFLELPASQPSGKHVRLP
jgi:hypothetical protein